MPRVRLIVLALLVLLAGCGKDSKDVGAGPKIGSKGGDESAAPALGFPAFATKNTTRVGGGDPTADAAAVALSLIHI